MYTHVCNTPHSSVVHYTALHCTHTHTHKYTNATTTYNTRVLRDTYTCDHTHKRHYNLHTHTITHKSIQELTQKGYHTLLLPTRAHTHTNTHLCLRAIKPKGRIRPVATIRCWGVARSVTHGSRGTPLTLCPRTSLHIERAYCT